MTTENKNQDDNRALDKEAFFYRVGYNSATFELMYFFAAMLPFIISFGLFLTTSYHINDLTHVNSYGMYTRLTYETKIDMMMPHLMNFAISLGFLMLAVIFYPKRTVRCFITKTLLERKLRNEKIKLETTKDTDELLSIVESKGFHFKKENEPKASI